MQTTSTTWMWLLVKNGWNVVIRCCVAPIVWFVMMSFLRIQTIRTWQEMERTGTIYDIMTSKEEVEYNMCL